MEGVVQAASSSASSSSDGKLSMTQSRLSLGSCAIWSAAIFWSNSSSLSSGGSLLDRMVGDMCRLVSVALWIEMPVVSSSLKPGVQSDENVSFEMLGLG